MSSSSSTSNSDAAAAVEGGSGERNRREPTSFSRLEQATPRQVPLAAIACVLVVMVVELLLSKHRVWFSDQAAWQWHSKQALLDDQSLDGDLIIMGTSVLFHSVDAASVNEQLREKSKTKVVNLAFNGMQLHAQYQMLSRYLDAGNSPSTVVIELRKADVENAAWKRGPYYRQWATLDEFTQSDSVYFQPSLHVSFLSHRALTSFAYRRALDNFVFDCARSRGLSTKTRDRNRTLAKELKEKEGFSRGGFDKGLTEKEIPKPKARPWLVTPSGELWLHRLLGLCADRKLKVVVLQPPAPPFVIEQRKGNDFDGAFERYVDSLRDAYPTLGLEILWPKGYALQDFADDHHLSPSGSKRLTDDLIQWIIASKSPNP